MSAWSDLVDRADRSRFLRELWNAVVDGLHAGWMVALIAAVVVWVARGLPSAGTAEAVAVLVPAGVVLAAWRAWRITLGEDAVDRRAAAGAAARRWATLYGLLAALLPAFVLASRKPLLGVLVVAAAAAALVELAIITIPLRARARLIARLRIGAQAVARDEEVTVGRARWHGTDLGRVMVSYPAHWAAHSATRRDELVERMMWELCGPPPRTPDEAVLRPDYISTFDHVDCRLILERVPTLPRRLAGRNWGQPPGRGIVLGQTTADLADARVRGIPVAVYQPRNHALFVGGTQHGKSSGVRAWAVDALTHGVFPGGLYAIDGKGSGSLAALIGRDGVHQVGHTPEEWRQIVTEVAALVRDRYQQMLDWRAGRSTAKPSHLLTLLILDEIQQVTLTCPDLIPVVDTLARQALESGVILWVITQRPDAKDAVPGAVRDQLLDRFTFGPLSSSGAKMAFDIAGDDWHRALGVAPIAGRALCWTSGTWRTVQAPWLPIPADVPAIEVLYPPRTAPQATPQTTPPPQPVPQPQAPTAPSTPTPPPTSPGPSSPSGSASSPRPHPTWPPPPVQPRRGPVDDLIEDFPGGSQPDENGPGSGLGRTQRDPGRGPADEGQEEANPGPGEGIYDPGKARRRRRPAD